MSLSLQNPNFSLINVKISYLVAVPPDSDVLPKVAVTSPKNHKSVNPKQPKENVAEHDFL